MIIRPMQGLGRDSLRKRGGVYLAAKRLIDLICSFAGIVVFSPALLIGFWLIIREDGFPVVFKQKRLTCAGREFLLFKIRTMVRDAGRILQLNPALMEEYRLKYKLYDDPRILKSGRFLRRTSIDELPQLFNVFAGDMSLVGPRPILPEELAKFNGEEDWYLQLKPGLAGLWQCSGRSEVGYPEIIEYDRAYFHAASLGTDLKIIMLTI